MPLAVDETNQLCPVNPVSLGNGDRDYLAAVGFDMHRFSLAASTLNLCRPQRIALAALTACRRSDVCRRCVRAAFEGYGAETCTWSCEYLLSFAALDVHNVGLRSAVVLKPDVGPS